MHVDKRVVCSIAEYEVFLRLTVAQSLWWSRSLLVAVHLFDDKVVLLTHGARRSSGPTMLRQAKPLFSIVDVNNRECLLAIVLAGKLTKRGRDHAQSISTAVRVYLYGHGTFVSK